jgi:hypothetical protein
VLLTEAVNLFSQQGLFGLVDDTYARALNSDVITHWAPSSSSSSSSSSSTPTASTAYMDQPLHRGVGVADFPTAAAVEEVKAAAATAAAVAAAAIGDPFNKAVSFSSPPSSTRRVVNRVVSRVVDLHGFPKPLANAAIRSALQEHHSRWCAAKKEGAAARREHLKEEEEKKKKQKQEEQSPEERVVERRRSRLDGTTPSERKTAPPQQQVAPPDLVIITGKGLHSVASFHEPVLRPDVMRMLVDEFNPPISSWTVPGNTGRLLVCGQAIGLWAESTALAKRQLMEKLRDVLTAKYSTRCGAREADGRGK